MTVDMRGPAALYVVLYHVQQLTRDSSGSVESLPRAPRGPTPETM